MAVEAPPACLGAHDTHVQQCDGEYGAENVRRVCVAENARGRW